jgi:hypothetical protein
MLIVKKKLWSRLLAFNSHGFLKEKTEKSLPNPCSGVMNFISSVYFILSLLQKKRLSITQSFGSEHSDSSEGNPHPLLLSSERWAESSPPRTPALADKDRSSTPLSSGSDEKQFVVKV